jgi:hypothetical protein
MREAGIETFGGLLPDAAGTIGGTGMERRDIQQIENELADITAEITALGDMIPAVIPNYEDIEPGTPGGIKLILTGIRKRIEGIRKRFAANFQPVGNRRED